MKNIKKVSVILISLVILVGVLLLINNYSLNINNYLTSKINANDTLTILREYKYKDYSVTFSVETNYIDNQKNTVNLEIDVFKKKFLNYEHIAGDSITLPINEKEISINKYIDQQNNQIYFYGIFNEHLIKEIYFQNNNNEKFNAEIISFKSNKFWIINVPSNTNGEVKIIKRS